MRTSISPTCAPTVLDRIAARLGVPVEAFSQAAEPSVAEHVAAMVQDPAGRQVAASFAAMPPEARASLAKVARVLAECTAERR